ncbi:MAG: YwiC-like family protein [Ilumatobacteraceae bacterium]|nr:YwiC-like family protein [Ilumatobacteraceae bacterium]
MLSANRRDVVASQKGMPPPSTTGGRPIWRAVAVPSEHGGWGLTLEPVLLGLLLAFSWSGMAVGVAAFLAFLVRTPLKIALGDLRRHRSLKRTKVATRFAVGELVAIVGLGLAVLLTAGGEWLWPVAVAAPLIGIELWFDVRSRSRRLVPELCGAVGIASVAAAIVVVGNGDARLAIAAWMILAARSLAAVPFVRTQIVRLRRGTAPLLTTDGFQAVGALLAAGAVAIEVSTVFGGIAVALLAAAHVVWLRRPVPPAKVLGLRQMVIGFSVVGATAIGVLTIG